MRSKICLANDVCRLTGVVGAQVHVKMLCNTLAIKDLVLCILKGVSRSHAAMLQRPVSFPTACWPGQEQSTPHSAHDSRLRPTEMAALIKHA
jgi:hypothetical protein